MSKIYGLKGKLDMIDSEGNKIDEKNVFFVITKIINKFDRNVAIIHGDIFFNKKSFKKGEGNINKWFFGDNSISWVINNDTKIHDSQESNLYDIYCSGKGNAPKDARNLLKKLDGNDVWDDVKINFRSFEEEDDGQ